MFVTVPHFHPTLICTAKLEPTRVEHFTEFYSQGRILALPVRLEPIRVEYYNLFYSETIRGAISTGENLKANTSTSTSNTSKVENSAQVSSC